MCNNFSFIINYDLKQMVQSIFDALLILLVCSAKFDLIIENLIEYLKNISERGKSRKPT